MSSKPLLDIGDKEWHIVKAILQQHVPDREVWAFGSRAKWTAKEFSDLDLAILGEKSLTLDESAALSDAFADSDLPWKVDVVDWVTTSASFRKIIERDKVSIQFLSEDKRETKAKSADRSWPFSELGKEAFNASRPFSFKEHPQVVFVNTSDVLQGKFLHSKISEGIGLPGQAKKALEKDDILLTEIRPGNGRYAYVDFPADKYVVSTKFMVIESRGRVKPRFLYHVLTNKFALDEFQRIAESRSGTFPQITFDSIEHFPVPVPPLHEQEELIHFFDGIDSRINLLRETNTTLEAIAQALFKSWFVDFEPVHAKMQGRCPEGMDEATAALFPDSFEELGIEPVPKGWHRRKLGDVCAYLNRGISPKYLETGGVLVINQKCIRDFSIDYEKARRHDPVQRKIDGRQLMIGDVLVNSTGVGTLGRVAQVLALPEIAIVDSHVTVVRAGESLTWSYLGQWMTRMQPEIEAMGEGSTGQTELARSKLSELSILVPGVEVLSAFDAIVLSLKHRIAVNEASASELMKLRDALLPRLISGQICAQDMEPIT